MMSNIEPASEALTPAAVAAVAEAKFVADALKIATKPSAGEKDFDRIRTALEKLPPSDILRVSDRLVKGIERHAKRSNDYGLLDRVLPHLPGQGPLERKILEEEARLSPVPSQSSTTLPTPAVPMAVQSTPTTSTTPAPEPAAPTPPPAIPATVAELVAELGRQAANDAKAAKYVAGLAEEIRNRPELEADATFLKRVVRAAQGLERDGATIPMTQELRDLVAPKTSAPAMPSATTQPPPEPAATTPTSTRQNTQATQQAPTTSAGQATAPPQMQNRAIGALGSAMAQLYAALRPPAPTTPAPWEQAPQPLGDRLAAFEHRATENAITSQTQAAQLAGERTQAALEKLGTGPGGAILSKIKEAAQNEPGGMPAVVAEMAPGGKFADLRTAFNAALVQERAFASAYDRAVSGIAEYGGARMKLNDTLGSRQMDVTAINDQFEGMDRTIGQASEALPGRKDGKSIQDELAEKAAKLAEFLKTMVQRIGNAIRPAATPAEAATPTPTIAPARAPAMAPSG